MKNASKWISLSLMAIFAFSTLAYSLIQGSRFKSSQHPITLPKQTILALPMSKQQQMLALQKGYTLIFLNYTNSQNSTEVKNYLETFAYKQKNQVYLIETPSKRFALDVRSLKGEESLNIPDVNKTEDLLCTYLLKPPIECVLRQV